MKTYLEKRKDALKKMHENQGQSHQATLDLMLGYLQDRTDNFSESTVLNDVKALIAFSKSIEDKQISELTAKDMRQFFDSISKKRPSAVLHRSKIAMFLRYADREDLAVLCKIKVPSNTRKLPEDMLTQEEIEQLIKATHNLRDAAFIALLYESGARRGELFELQLKHIKFDDYGAVITLPKGKTGPRRIRVVFSASYLRNWVDHHPGQNNRESPVWISLKDNTKTAEYTTFRDMLQRAAKQAGIAKHVNMHNFRHSRATHLAKDLTEQQLKVYLGWTQGSSMAARYVHLSGKDVDPAILKLHGIQVKEEDSSNTLKVTKCPRCKEIQDSESLYCFKCGMPLTSAAQKDEKSTEDTMKQLLLDPEIMEAIVAALQAKTV